jgi:acyl-CoA synthetase (AMP-forming)/AMP-acid ligase II/thioesterase domain-containing protein/acyl carrier protein
MALVLRESLFGSVAAHAAARPDTPALLGPDCRPCTYGELAQHLHRLRTMFANLAPASRPIVAVAAGNGPELFTAIVAAMSSGVCAPVDRDRPPEEIDAFLTEIKPQFVLADETALARHGDTLERHGVTVMRMIPAKTAAAGIFDVRVEGAPHPASGDAFLNDPDLALLVRTSGTTSLSKIVPHTMARLMHVFAAIVDAVALQPTDRCLNARPLHHLHAIVHVIGASLVAGASVVCPAETGAAALVRGLRTFSPTWYSASPPVHRDVLALLQTETAPLGNSLRFVRSSSAAMDPQLAVDLEAALGAAVLQGYGMSEAAAIALNSPPPRVHKPGSVGRPVGCEIAIHDGEVVIRGANVAPAYAGAERRPIIDPETGWFHTGDAGTIDADGYLYLTGRLNELINVGGEKVAPANVERALLTHPAIVDAVAFPLPHPTLGQHVAAAVVTSAGATVTPTELIEHAAHLVPRQAVPNVVHVVPNIARDGNGKVRRRDLAATFARDPRAALSDQAYTMDDPLIHALTRMWESVLEYTPVALDENFFAAGGDSLRAIRLLTRIETLLGVTLPPDALLYAPTIVTLRAAVLAQTEQKRTSRIIALRTAGTRPPLVFFDGDINGGGLYARFLETALDPGQPIYVVRPYGVLGDTIPESIERIADADAALIAATVPAPAYRLAGYCNGGVVAFEVARRLEAAGATVDRVVLVGSSAPNAGLDWVWAVAGCAATFTSQRDPARIYQPLRKLANALRTRPASLGLRHLARAAGRRVAYVLGVEPPDPAPQPDRSSPNYRIYRELIRRYFPQRYGRRVDVIWADGDEPRIMGDKSMGWRHVARVRRHAMGGNHTTMLTDHVGELGAAMRRILDAADRR